MPGFTTLVATAARFRRRPETGEMIQTVGAISRLTGMKYWSTTHGQWRTLILKANALTGAQGTPRADFSERELVTGSVLFFEQNDNLSGKARYRLHIAEATPERIVFDLENATPLRYFFLPVLGVGEMQSVCFLDRESDNVWRYYSLVRTGRNANRTFVGSEASAINRAVAFFRSLAGIPSDQEPPAAR